MAGGSDQLIGGSGNDGLLARDGLADTVDCGTGAADSAVTDRLSLDAVGGCESVDALPEPSILPPPGAVPSGAVPPASAPAPTKKKKCKKRKHRKHAAAAKKKKCKKKKRKRR